ncbi:MAG: radical SAM protein [Acidobacteriota bacterium]
MKVALVSPYSDVTSIGIRIIAAYLKQHGHEVRQVFIPHEPSEKLLEKRKRWEAPPGEYGSDLLDQFGELMADRDLVGMTLMTNYFHRCAALVGAMRGRSKARVIWGGIHPTVRAKECLEHADFVCSGEGEDTMLELADNLDRGGDGVGLAGLWWRKKAGDSYEKTEGPKRPNPQNLDAFPFPDYELADDYYFDEKDNRFVKADFNVQKKFMAMGHISRIRKKVAYQTLATRGCPLNCSYCANNALRAINVAGKYLRRRSNENFIQELETAVKKMPYVEVMGFSDDVFFHAPERDIAEFSRMYKERVNLPFFALTSPLSITETKMENLVNAGLFGLQMGIESGDPETLKLYMRGIEDSKTLESARVISKFVNRPGKPSIDPPVYDLIVDNPYETEKQVLRTFRFMLLIPRPYRLQIFSLVFFPGTALADKAARDGYITDASLEGYTKEYHMRRASYLNILFGMARLGVPVSMLRFLSEDTPVKWMNREMFNKFYALVYGAYRKLKMLTGGRALLAEDS